MPLIPSLPIILQNGTTADATQVMANFNAIVNGVNTNAANAGINTNITQLQGLTVALAVNQGGTGSQILTPNGVLLGEGTNNINAVAPGANGTVLVSNGPGQDPSFGCPYRVGDLYITTLSANPSTFYTGTTWTVYGAGQVLIGVGTFTDGDGTSQTVAGGQQLGEYKHTLTAPELPINAYTDSGHLHGSLAVGVSKGAGGGVAIVMGTPNDSGVIDTLSGTANISNPGGGGGHSSIQPSIGVYIWQRTA